MAAQRKYPDELHERAVKMVQLVTFLTGVENDRLAAP
jgi:hypothetical protein